MLGLSNELSCLGGDVDNLDEANLPRDSLNAVIPLVIACNDKSKYKKHFSFRSGRDFVLSTMKDGKPNLKFQ